MASPLAVTHVVPNADPQSDARSRAGQRHFGQQRAAKTKQACCARPGQSGPWQAFGVLMSISGVPPPGAVYSGRACSLLALIVPLSICVAAPLLICYWCAYHGLKQGLMDVFGCTTPTECLLELVQTGVEMGCNLVMWWVMRNIMYQRPHIRDGIKGSLTSGDTVAAALLSMTLIVGVMTFATSRVSNTASMPMVIEMFAGIETIVTAVLVAVSAVLFIAGCRAASVPTQFALANIKAAEGTRLPPHQVLSLFRDAYHSIEVWREASTRLFLMINLMCFCSLLTIACYVRQLMGGTSPPSQIVGFLIFATGNLAACLSADWHAAGATTALRQIPLALSYAQLKLGRFHAVDTLSTTASEGFKLSPVQATGAREPLLQAATAADQPHGLLRSRPALSLPTSPAADVEAELDLPTVSSYIQVLDARSRLGFYVFGFPLTRSNLRSALITMATLLWSVGTIVTKVSSVAK